MATHLQSIFQALTSTVHASIILILTPLAILDLTLKPTSVILQIPLHPSTPLVNTPFVNKPRFAMSSCASSILISSGQHVTTSVDVNTPFLRHVSLSTTVFLPATLGYRASFMRTIAGEPVWNVDHPWRLHAGASTLAPPAGASTHAGCRS